MNTPIITVVPQPGATFPYSELSGRNTVPNRVIFPVPGSLPSLAGTLTFVAVLINC